VRFLRLTGNANSDIAVRVARTPSESHNAGAVTLNR
jgi:hypothetical protein